MSIETAPPSNISMAVDGSGTLATRNPRLSLSFEGSRLRRKDARRKLSPLTQEPPRSPREDPAFVVPGTLDDQSMTQRLSNASASFGHGRHGQSMPARWPARPRPRTSRSSIAISGEEVFSGSAEHFPFARESFHRSAPQIRKSPHPRQRSKAGIYPGVSPDAGVANTLWLPHRIGGRSGGPGQKSGSRPHSARSP